MRTWDYWMAHRVNGEPIGLEHYEAIGTMSDALSKHADEAFAELPDERSKQVAEALFKALTERGGDNRELRRPTCLKDICEIAGASPAEVSAVVEVFRAVGRSFLMPPAGVPLQPDTVIDISHESLIRNWERLKDWARDEAEAARIYGRLAGAAADYHAGFGGLLDEVTLQYALKWREKYKPNRAWGLRYQPGFDEAIDYLEASNAASDAAKELRERQRQEQIDRERRELETARAFAEKQARSATRMRRLTVALCAILVLALGAMVVAIRARSSALKSQNQVQAALQRNGLIRQGLEALGRDHSGEALKSFDCLSYNLQTLLPKAPHLPFWSEKPCDQTAAEDESGQLELQLAWVYSNLGSTASSIADQDWVPDATPEVTPDNANPSDVPDKAKREDVKTKRYYYSRALDAYEQAVRILEPLVKDDDADLLSASQGLARAYHQVALSGYEPLPGVQKEKLSDDEYFKKADVVFSRVLSIQERRVEKDPADVATEHLNLARLYHDMNKDAEAERNFLQAVDLWDRSAKLKAESGDVDDEDSSAQQISVRKELAEFYESLDRRLPDAEKAYDQIIDIQENYDLSRAHEVADSYSELGQLYQAQNKGEKATLAFRLASLLPQAALKYRRDGIPAVCFDMVKLAPIYFKLERYVQVKQVYDIAIESPCMDEKAEEVEGILDQVIGKLATHRSGPAPINGVDDVSDFKALRARVAAIKNNPKKSSVL
jgi:hypothetical protein